MTSSFRLSFLAIILFAAIATPALAQEACVGCEPLNQDGNDPCPTYDSCTLYEKGWYSNGTFILIPMACKQTWCRACDSRHRCVSVHLDANCQCDDVPVEGAGPNITTCSNMYGTCIAR